MKSKLLATLEQNKAYLKSLGVEIPFALKRRDTQEPGRKEKEDAEDKYFGVLRKYFAGQKQRITDRLSNFLIKVNPLDEYFWQQENDELVTQLTKLLTESSQNGIALFGQLEKIGLDYSLSNQQAAEWASKYAFDLVKGINDSTRDTVSQAIQRFVNIPGYTLKDVINSLPYSDERALKIAVTEVTRAYSQGNLLAAQQLREEYPNVRVTKRWFTNNDDRVCPLCGPLDGKSVTIDKEFEKGIDAPPRHINCRCWISTSTELKK